MNVLAVKQAVAFAILMQHEGGIMGKSPEYVQEKMQLCGVLEDPEQALDGPNKALYRKWCRKWLEQNSRR